MLQKGNPCGASPTAQMFPTVPPDVLLQDSDAQKQWATTIKYLRDLRAQLKSADDCCSVGAQGSGVRTPAQAHYEEQGRGTVPRVEIMFGEGRDPLSRTFKYQV
jgi:hypothetical protein